MAGEAAEVPQNLVEDWTKRLPALLSGYTAENIFNADETGLYFLGMGEC